MKYKELNDLVNSLFADEIVVLKDILEVNKPKDNSMNELILDSRDIKCPFCHTSNFVRNGKKNGKQRYRCKNCNHSFSDNSNSITFRTQSSFEKWIRFVECELHNFILEDSAKECDISISTAFRWRIKLYSAISEMHEQVKLSGVIQIDAKFYSINLKGTKPENMPRYSKNRSSSAYRGISHHKVCVLTGIDEYDNIVIKIAGTGRENTSMMINFKPYVDTPTTIVCDGSHTLITFAKQFQDVNIEIVKSKTGRYNSNNGYNLADINEIHSELDKDLKCRRGVSLKHLQGYLDMFWFKKLLRYTVDYHDRPGTFIRNAVSVDKTMYVKQIFEKAFPFDLNKVYSDFKK